MLDVFGFVWIEAGYAILANTSISSYGILWTLTFITDVLYAQPYM